MAEHHVGACGLSRLSIERHRDLICQLRVVELRKCTFTEGERRLELVDEFRLRPRCLDRVSGGAVLWGQRGLHCAKVVAEEVVVARQMLRDVSDGELRWRRL